MPRSSTTVRLYLTQEQAVKAVEDAIEHGRVKLSIKQREPTYFKLKQQRSFIHPPIKLEVGLLKESPNTTLVVMNGKLGLVNGLIQNNARLEDQLAQFADDVEAAASRYIRQ
jgi:hypothetical protein